MVLFYTIRKVIERGDDIGYNESPCRKLQEINKLNLRHYIVSPLTIMRTKSVFILPAESFTVTTTL
jgi:hypothetical protein